jgi:hypothetical protein
MHQEGGEFASTVGVASSIRRIKGERKGEGQTKLIVMKCVCVSESENERGIRGRERKRTIDVLIEIDR